MDKHEKSFDVRPLAKLLPKATVQVILAYRNSPVDWDFRRVPLYGEAPAAFRERILENTLDVRDNRAVRPYDPEWVLTADQYSVLALGTPPLGGNFFSHVSGFADFEPFEEKKRVRKPSMWVVVAQLDDGTIAYFGSRITARAVLDQAGRLLRLIHRDQGFDMLDDTVLTFDANVDWIAWRSSIAIINSNHFHASFRDIPALVKMVDQHVATVAKHVPIVNADEFAARIRSYPAMAVKLSRIVERGDMHTRTAAELRDYGSEYAIEVEWNGDSMIFDGSVERQWNILRLLDEAGTLGPVTGKKYDTAGKVPIA